MNTINSLLEKIENAKTLDFGDVFSQCIELFKKVWLQGLVSYLLNIVMMIPLMFVIYIPMIFLGIFRPDSFGENMDFSGLTVLVAIVFIVLFVAMFVVIIAISLALKASFYRIVRNKDLNLNKSDDYFFFLKKKYLKKTLVLGVTILGIIIAAYVLCFLPVFYVIIPVYYMTVIFAMNPDMPNSEIIKAGFKLGNKKWFFSFGLLFVAWVLSAAVGFLMCLVGIYATQQFIDLPFYHVYKEIIGFSSEDEINEIGVISK